MIEGEQDQPRKYILEVGMEELTAIGGAFAVAGAVAGQISAADLSTSIAYYRYATRSIPGGSKQLVDRIRALMRQSMVDLGEEVSDAGR